MRSKFANTTTRNYVIIPREDKKEDIPFIGIGIYIFYAKTQTTLPVIFDAIRSLFTLPLHEASKILGVSVTTIKHCIRNKVLESDVSLVPEYPRIIFMELARNKRWPYRRMTLEQKTAIQKFREALLHHLKKYQLDHRLINIVYKAWEYDQQNLVQGLDISPKNETTTVLLDATGGLEWPLSMDKHLCLDFWSE
jgi:hypothetical protein